MISKDKSTILLYFWWLTEENGLKDVQSEANYTAPDSIVPNKFAFLRTLTSNWSRHHTTYWQHGDHLGSASWVTDTNGVGYQHLQYMPWGEQWVDQRKTGYSYNTRYTFSGKERDEETGFSYFGARHYNSDLSVWLSVDPMSDKYPSLSPYTYCANNPVVLKDPNGREVYIRGEAAKDFFHQVRIGAKAYGISVKMDKDGKLSAKYKGKGEISEDGAKLMNAITDQTVKVNVNAIEHTEGDMNYMFGGMFGGNEIAGEVIDGHFIGQMAIANQIVKPSELNKLDNAYGKYGQTSLHEITEAYIGARLSMERGHSSIGTGMNSYIFQEAHEAAIPQAGPVLYGCFGNEITGEMWIEWQDNKGNLLKDLDIPNSK